MLIQVYRYMSNEHGTLGILKVNGEFRCYTLEDPFRAVKVPGETRIPGGIYRLALRDEGGMTRRYEAKYPYHVGMLWLQDVPGFEWVYIHVGNQVEDTEGCILVGRAPNFYNEYPTVANSTAAYERIYPEISEAVIDGEASIQILEI